MEMVSTVPGAPVDLETTGVTQAGQITNLRFRVAK
jgi:hypothetical protein